MPVARVHAGLGHAPQDAPRLDSTATVIPEMRPDRAAAMRPANREFGEQRPEASPDRVRSDLRAWRGDVIALREIDPQAPDRLEHLGGLHLPGYGQNA